jgi:hypothetical protein
VVEQTLFVGFTTMALGITTYVFLWRRDDWLRRSYRRWWTAITLAVLVPVSVLLSLPPAYKAGSVPIPMPSILVAGVTSYWRVYSRFGMIAGFALALLAALALSAVAARGGWLGRLLAPLALVAVVLELLPGNIAAFSTTAEPGWVAWLASAPRGIVATYPLAYGGSQTGFTVEQYWYQALDRDPGFVIANQNLDGFLSREQAIRWLAVDPNAPITARVLSREGVRYVVINDRTYEADGNKPPRPDPRHYTLLARRDGVRIFSVHAAPADIESALRSHEASIARREGFKSPKIEPGASFLPLASRGVIGVDNSRGASRIRLTAHTLNRGASTTIRILDAKGQTLARARIPAGSGELQSVPLDVPAQAHFKLSIIPADPKSKLYLSRLKLEPVPAYVASPAGIGD